MLSLIKRRNYWGFFFFLCLALIFSLFSHKKSRFLYEKRPKKWIHGAIDRIETLDLPKSLSIFSKNNAYLRLKKRSWNPSIIPIQDHFLMFFRNAESGFVSETPLSFRYVSERGAVHAIYLDQDLRPISKEFPLLFRKENGESFNIPEDPRLFWVGNNLFCLVVEKVILEDGYANELYLTKVKIREGEICFSKAKRLRHPSYSRRYEKNWIPFTHENSLYVVYETEPYEILKIDPLTGKTDLITKEELDLHWKYGYIAGSTNPISLSPISLSKEQLTFFHSFVTTTPTLFRTKPKSHYFFGAYTFSKEPPFLLQRYTEVPFFDAKLYNVRINPDQIVFPMSLIQSRDKVIMASGINDRCIAFMELNLKAILNNMKPYSEPKTK